MGSVREELVGRKEERREWDGVGERRGEKSEWRSGGGGEEKE